MTTDCLAFPTAFGGHAPGNRSGVRHGTRLRDGSASAGDGASSEKRGTYHMDRPAMGMFTATVGARLVYIYFLFEV